jgi:WD40-like Beta Propeller Repeat
MLKKLEPIGEAKPVAEQVLYVSGSAGAFSSSSNGVLAYRTGPGMTAGLRRLVWVDRKGTELEQVGPPGPYFGVDLDPVGGKRLAVHRHEGTGGDIEILESQKAPIRLTFDASQDNSNPVWSPDGERIAFVSTRNGKQGIYVKRLDSGEEELLWPSEQTIAPISWSPDDSFLLFVQTDPETNNDLWLLPLNGEKTPIPFAPTHQAENSGQFSPYGKWVAYSWSSGPVPEIYVKSYASGAVPQQISRNFGLQPRWRADMGEISYNTRAGKLVAVDVKRTGQTLDFGLPNELFDYFPQNGVTNHLGSSFLPFAVSKNGQRFLVSLPLKDESAGEDSKRILYCGAQLARPAEGVAQSVLKYGTRKLMPGGRVRAPFPMFPNRKESARFPRL